MPTRPPASATTRRTPAARLAALVTVPLALLVATISASAQTVDRAEHHRFDLRDFRTESGVVLPTATVVYGTYGHLNAAKDNAILLPSHYMANHHGYEWLIGPGKALDTSRVFLVATELFGNGQSSSPSNTPEPFHGPRFPTMTIRDNVAAVHTLLTRGLGITHLRAIIGFSMGAQQAFQWAVSHPTFADRIVATAGTAKTWPHGIVRLEGQISALTADPAFNNGDYTAPPTRGLSAFGMVWGGWLYSQEWWRRELWKEGRPAGYTFDQAMERFRSNFIPGADANNLLLQMRSWERHDVSQTPGLNGDLARALGSIQVPFLYMPSETDLYFPIGDATYEASMMRTVTFAPIRSLWGHTAGAASNPADAAFLNRTIGAFLGAPAAPPAPPAVPSPVRSTEVYAIRYGTLPRFAASGLIAGADTARRLDIALMVWLIRQPDGRNILVDAGFYREKFLTRWKPADYQRPSEAVRALGLSPDDITDVLISHVHWDHLDGADLFPKARIWLQREELTHHLDSLGQSRDRILDPVDATMLAELQRAGRLRLIDGDNQAPMPGVRVYTGGKHTFASQYVSVETPEGPVVLASDNAYLYENLATQTPIAQTLDSASNRRAQARMLQLAGDPRRVVPGHDALVFTRFPSSSTVVTRIK